MKSTTITSLQGNHITILGIPKEGIQGVIFTSARSHADTE